MIRRLRRHLARRRDWRARLRNERLRRLGLTPEAYRDELDAAWRVWRGHWPWKALPQWLATLVFAVAGRRFAARWIAARAREG